MRLKLREIERKYREQQDAKAKQDSQQVSEAPENEVRDGQIPVRDSEDRQEQ